MRRKLFSFVHYFCSKYLATHIKIRFGLEFVSDILTQHLNFGFALQASHLKQVT